MAPNNLDFSILYITLTALLCNRNPPRYFSQFVNSPIILHFGCYYGFHQKTGNTTICPIKGDDLSIEFDTQNTQNLSYYVYAA